MDRDTEHLHILSIMYYIVAGLNLLGSCCGGFYAGLGLLVGMNPQQFNQQPLFASHPGQPQPPSPEFMMWLFTIMGSIMIVMTVVMAIAFFFSGRCLAKHRGRTYCLIVAGLSCILIPMGTILGVFTFIVLLRPSVKELFEAEKLASQ